MDFLPVIILYLEVLILAFAEKKLWNTWFTPLNCLSVPYALVLAVCLCVDGNMGFVPFYYPSVWVWAIGLAVFFVPSLLLALRQRQKNGTAKAEQPKEVFVSPCTRRILEYITWAIFALFFFWFCRLTFVKDLSPGSESFALEWAGHGFFGHLFTVLMGLNIFWLFAADKTHKRYWIYVFGFFVVALLFLVKGWFLTPMAAGLLLRLLTGKTKFGIKVILLSLFTGFSFFFASYWLTLYVNVEEKHDIRLDQKKAQDPAAFRGEVSSYIGKHALTYVAAGVYGLSEDLAQNTLEYREPAKIYAPFVNICKLFGNKDYVSHLNNHFIQITTHDLGSNIRSFFGTLYVFLGDWHAFAYVLVFSSLIYLLFAFALKHRYILALIILGWFLGCLLMGWFDIIANTLTFISLPCFLLAIFGLCHLWENRAEITFPNHSVWRKTRRFLASFQTISFSLFLLFFGLSSQASYVFLGISASLAFLFLLMIPRKAIDLRFFKQSISFLLIYLLLWISVFYSSYPESAAIYTFKQTAILLVPFVFCGMTPRFFSPKRLHFFALCFVIGCVLLLLAKVVQSAYCFNLCWPYFKTWYIDLNPYMSFGRGMLVSVNEFLSYQGIYFSWVYLQPIMHTTLEAMVFTIAFVLVFIARVQKHPFLDSRFKKCIADFVLILFTFALVTSYSKTGQFVFIVTLFLLLVFVLRNKQWKIACGFIGVLLLFGCLGFYYFGSGISGRFERSLSVVEEIKDNKEILHTDNSLLPRIYCWQTAIKMVKEKPIFGYGMGFRKDFDAHFAADHPDYYRSYRHPHNQFLFALISNGILGLLVFLLFWVQAVFLVWKSRRLWGWIWLLGLFLLCCFDTIFFESARLYFCLPYCFLMADYYNRNNPQRFPSV
ncbi:MAG: O-antigen ligase family protein [Lentimicrobiaceae bacterium]|nr:O-antigen ligase family protein [Lentimicrobiaceae bacterium]